MKIIPCSKQVRMEVCVMEINQLLKNLSWNMPEKIQQEAMEELINILDDNIEILIQPLIDKSCWENAAKVIKEIGYPGNKNAIKGLIEWLQDMNWPGAVIASETLYSIGFHIIYPSIQNAVNYAISEYDIMWLENIRHLIISMDCSKSSIEYKHLINLFSNISFDD
jgi:HEAT repeat protein